MPQLCQAAKLTPALLTTQHPESLTVSPSALKARAQFLSAPTLNKNQVPILIGGQASVQAGICAFAWLPHSLMSGDQIGTQSAIVNRQSSVAAMRTKKYSQRKFLDFA